MRFKLLLEATANEASFNTFISLTSTNNAEAKNDLIEAGKQFVSEIVGTGNSLFAYISAGGDNSIKLLNALQNMASNVGKDRTSAIIQLLSRIQINKISNPACFTNFIALGNFYQSSKIDLSEPFLTKPSLYSRGPLDFNYAVEALKIAHNPTELKKRFGDHKSIKVEDLYIGDDIKPSGAVTKDKSDFSTIYGVFATWKTTASGEKPTVKTNDYPEYKNFADAEKDKVEVIKINGLFKYNKDAKTDFKWEPLKN